MRKKTGCSENGGLFWPKNLRLFSKKYYINSRYDRRNTEDLRPPHFWQTNSNYGSLRWNYFLECQAIQSACKAKKFSTTLMGENVATFCCYLSLKNEVYHKQERKENMKNVYDLFSYCFILTGHNKKILIAKVYAVFYKQRLSVRWQKRFFNSCVFCLYFSLPNTEK